MIMLLLTVATVCLLLAAHPFTTYPASLLLMRVLHGRRRLANQSGSPAAAPTFAICMCAYNEEAVIAAKLANLLQLRARHPGLGIHIYVDASTDRTAELLLQSGADVDLHISGERRGKTYGMNLLSAQANSDVLVYTDANVMLDLKCLDDLSRHFRDSEVGCVCGNLTYVNADASATAASGSLYWRFEECLKRLESEVGSTMGADGSIFAVRRRLREPPPEHIIDDMYVSLMVLIRGSRVVQVRDVRAFERSATGTGEEFARKVRIACQAFNVHRLLWPRLRRLDGFTRYAYLSHKVLRWLSIYFLALALLAFVTAGVLAGLGGAIATVLLLALVIGVLGRRWSITPIAQAVELLVALCGAGLGVWRALRGERFQTWAPVGSVRGA